MYADKITPSMEKAIDETNRRREKQVAYNKAAGVDPQPLRKKIADITEMLAREDETPRSSSPRGTDRCPRQQEQEVAGAAACSTGRSDRARCPTWPACPPPTSPSSCSS